MFKEKIIIEMKEVFKENSFWHRAYSQSFEKMQKI